MPNRNVTLRHDGGYAVIVQAHYVQPGELIYATRSQEARLVEDHPGVFARVHPPLEELPRLGVSKPLAPAMPAPPPEPTPEPPEPEVDETQWAEDSPTFCLVDINTAEAVDFEELPGIGPKLAERIAAYREEHGPFFDVGEIQNVEGISAGTFAEIGARICAVVPDDLETD